MVKFLWPCFGAKRLTKREEGFGGGNVVVSSDCDIERDCSKGRAVLSDNVSDDRHL